MGGRGHVEVRTLAGAAATVIEKEKDAPEVSDLMVAARRVWDTVERPAWYDLATPLLEKESMLPIDLLLRYFATKNDICKDATNMPPQLGNVRILIPDQGIEFRGSEETISSGGQKYPALTVVEGVLTLQHDHGSIKGVVPTAPVFYKVQVRQSGGQRFLRQLVAIKTEPRTIFVVGHAGTTMRKEIWARWQRLIEALPVPAAPSMPMVASREKAQENLDAWALERNLPPAEAPADVISREITSAQ
ncbi:MAG: hypothetical protein AB1327_07830 [Bacillota bacterium]